MKLNRLKVICTVTVLGILGFFSVAHAQYIWLDEKGVKQYSDMAPPASVPQKRILKEPRSPSRTPAAIPSEPATEVAVGETSDKDNAPMTTTEKNADFKKRRAEQAEKDKKAADEAKLAADKAKHCEQVRANQRALQSGDRLARTDKNGERYFLNDEQRAKEAQDIQRALDGCK